MNLSTLSAFVQVEMLHWLWVDIKGVGFADFLNRLLSVYSIERPGLADWWWEDKSVGLISTVSDCVDGCIGVCLFGLVECRLAHIMAMLCCWIADFVETAIHSGSSVLGIMEFTKCHFSNKVHC